MIATSSLLLTGFRHEWLRRSSAAVAFGLLALAPSVVRAQAPCPNPVLLAIPPPNLTAPAATLVPDDACVPTTVPGNGNPIAYFDDYSWKAFIAFVWPALNGQRGTPDPSQPLGAAGAPLVFETFKADWETFQPGGASPTPWSKFTFGSAPCPNVQPGDFVLSSFSKFGNVGEAGTGDFTAVLIAENGPSCGISPHTTSPNSPRF